MTHADSVEGLVEQRNATGVRVQGQWFTQSKFRAVVLPEVGQHVRVSSDTKGFLVDVEVLDDNYRELPAQVSQAAVRLAVLQIAAGFASTRPEARSTDVLPLADKWLAWIEEGA
jgi:hypothetical protein